MYEVNRKEDLTVPCERIEHDVTVITATTGGVRFFVSSSPGGEEVTEHELAASPAGEGERIEHDITVTEHELAASPAGGAAESPNGSQKEGFPTPSPLALLDFTPAMKDLINAGAKMTPAPQPLKPLTRLERHQDRRRLLEESPIPQLSWQERPTTGQPSSKERPWTLEPKDVPGYWTAVDGHGGYMTYPEISLESQMLSGQSQNRSFCGNYYLENTFDY